MAGTLLSGTEIYFDKSHNYPKEFTFIVISKKDPVACEGNDFEIEVYTKEQTSFEPL